MEPFLELSDLGANVSVGLGQPARLKVEQIPILGEEVVRSAGVWVFSRKSCNDVLPVGVVRLGRDVL